MISMRFDQIDRWTYIIVHEIGMCIVDSIIHNCCGDIFSCVSKCPSFFNIEIKSRFSTGLTNIFLWTSSILFESRWKSKDLLPNTIDIERKDLMEIDNSEIFLCVHWSFENHVWHEDVEFDEQLVSPTKHHHMLDFPKGNALDPSYKFISLNKFFLGNISSFACMRMRWFEINKMVHTFVIQHLFQSNIQ